MDEAFILRLQIEERIAESDYRWQDKWLAAYDPDILWMYGEWHISPLRWVHPATWNRNFGWTR